MKKWLKNKLGITEMEQAAEAAALRRQQEEERIATLQEQKATAEEAAEQAAHEEELAKMSPKERATANGEPWINVLDVKVNEENIRNGFFELDWNDIFIQELIVGGYGSDGDPQEEIVDRWFKDIVYNMLADEGLDTERGAGYINVTPIDKGRSEIS